MMARHNRITFTKETRVATSPPSKPPKDDPDSIIALRVGPGTQIEITEFRVHRSLLQSHSGFFKSILADLPGNPPTIRLPDEDADLFGFFVNWLYSGTGKISSAAPPDYMALSFEQTVRIWCFSDREEVPLLQNRCVDVFISKMAFGFRLPLDIAAIRYAYLNAKPDSNLRKLVAFTMANSRDAQNPGDGMGKIAEEDWFGDCAKDVVKERLTGEFLMYEGMPGFNRCQYHEHEEGESCKDGKGWKIC